MSVAVSGRFSLRTQDTDLLMIQLVAKQAIREEVAKMHCEVEMCAAGQVTTVLANYRNEWMGATAHWVVLCAGGWAVAVPS